MKRVWLVIAVAFVMALLLPFVAIGAVILLLESMTFLIPFVLVLYLSLGMVLIINFFDIEKGKKVVYRGIMVAIVASLIYSIPGFYDRWMLVVRDTSVSLEEYSPFSENTKAVKLDGPSTLKIEDNLPVIDGATALYPLYAAFVQAVYPEKEYLPYAGEVMSNRTGEAYENLIYGRVDMIFALAPSADQIERAKQNNRELKLTPIGKEAFVFFVNSKNPVKSLTPDELKGIYSGEIKSWKEVGGKKKSIRAFQRAENTGSQTALQRFMGDVPIMDPPAEDIVTLMGTMLDVVSDYKNYQNAIGYTFRYYSTQMVKNNDIRLLHVNGVEPSVESIRAGEYPITNELYVVTAGSSNPHIDEFIEWILSEQGQELVEKTGYVSIGR